MVINKNFWRHRSVLVTGCTGFLGSWLTRYLVERKARVVGLVRDWVPQSLFFIQGLEQAVRVVEGEVEDFPLLERTLNEYEVDTVFHLAAQTIVGIANANPLSTFEANVRGTWNLLEACRRVPQVKRIVVASSDKAYGEQSRLPYDEEARLEGTHPYDVSKSCADLIAAAYRRTYRSPVCVTRCGNFYGGGDLNFNRIVPGTIRSVLFNEDPIIRSDGNYVRDYIYVEDAALAYLLLAERMEDPGIHGGAFNFSLEKPLTALEMVRTLLRLMGKKRLKPRILNEASNEILKQYLSSSKARRRLGWKPRFGLEQGLRRTIAWYRNFLKNSI